MAGFYVRSAQNAIDDMCVPHIHSGWPGSARAKRKESATMRTERMFKLASALGEAKGRQNVADALRFMHDDIVLSSPAWGLVARGKAENAEVLAHFFHDFPDYGIALEGHVADAEHLLCWGTVRMTMRHGTYGVTPNGRRVEIPAFLRFTFREDLIASEYFMVDLAEICRQSGVSTDAVQRAAFGQSAARQPDRGGESVKGIATVTGEVETEFLFEARVRLYHLPIDVGPGPEGHRGIFVVEGGTFEGPRMRGKVLPNSGADWARLRPDGTWHLDVRFALQTDDGAVLYLHWHGRFHASPEYRDYALDLQKPDDPAGAHRYYFRAAPEFETSDSRYAWLNGIVAVTKSRTGGGGVIHRVFAVR
jgi:predicted ester cyclase